MALERMRLEDAAVEMEKTTETRAEARKSLQDWESNLHVLNESEVAELYKKLGAAVPSGSNLRVRRMLRRTHVSIA